MVQFLLLHRKEPGVARELLELGVSVSVSVNILTSAVSY